jgi:hypothetical protein
MTTFRMHTDDGGEHYAYSHGQTHGDPFPTVAAAARFIAALNGTRRLMVLVSRSSYTRSPCDSYVKTFSELDGQSAAEQLSEASQSWSVVPRRPCEGGAVLVAGCAPTSDYVATVSPTASPNLQN